MYAKFFKRFFDIIFSIIALVILSPVFLVLTVTGSIEMRGNPFFLQKRPGKIDKKTGKEKIFSLIKFRTMSNAKDKDGNLLPDDQRLGKYGAWLRSTSLDELPELINIAVGHLSCCGPRPLLVSYLPRYSSEQRRRHDVRPGLTGYAQAYGRNSLTWEEKFEKDVYYVDNISFLLDVKIILKTISVVFKREGISSDTSVTMEEFKGTKTEIEMETVSNE